MRILVSVGSIFLCSLATLGQEFRNSPISSPSPTDSPAEVRALSELIHELQAQVQTLNSQLGDLRMQQERTSADARELRRELDLVKGGRAPVAEESVAEPATA